MSEIPNQNPPVKETKPEETTFPENEESKTLKDIYLSEIVLITNETKNELIEESLRTAGQIQGTILSMDKVWIEKWQKSFDKEISSLIKNNIEFKGELSKISEIIKSPALTEKLLNLLEWESNLTKRQEEIKAYLWPLNNFYKRSAIILWKKLDENDFKKISKEKESFSEELTKSYKKWEEENPEKARKENIKTYWNNENSESNNSESYTWESYDYNIESWIINIDLWDTTKDIVVKESQKRLLQNEEARENFVSFYKTLNELWLSDLWDYIETISIAIWNSEWTNINFNDDFLDKNEQKIFLNAILKSVWIKEIDKTLKLEEFKNLFIQKNSDEILWWFKNDSDKPGDSKIAETFIEKYILNKTTFQNSSFSKEIQKNSK